MEVLGDVSWDIVISGTGLSQSLLALSLSRSGKKVLHVDKHNYYGGADAGLNVDDATSWVKEVSDRGSRIFSQAEIQPNFRSEAGAQHTIQSPRSYTLSLNPQIIYAQSKLLPSLVSSQIHTQLEFLAVGSWWILRDGKLQKIPSNREDVFADESLSMRDKRGLMKFLRYVVQEEEEPGHAEDEENSMLQPTLTERFGIPPSFTAPILALALSYRPAQSTNFVIAKARVRQHMLSIGYFGQGFGAVVAKYAGNAEIAQVACRAGAVGGGVYLLGQGIASIRSADNSESPTPASSSTLLEVTLSNGVIVRSHYVAGTSDDLPVSVQDGLPDLGTPVAMTYLVAIVDSSLSQLFPQTSDNGPIPAAAIVLADDSPADQMVPPIYLQIHAEDTGECPKSKCIVYASVQVDDHHAKARLREAVESLLHANDLDPATNILWSMTYVSKIGSTEVRQLSSKDLNNVIELPYRRNEIALDDQILDDVKEIWEKVIGEYALHSEFMRFSEREQNEDGLDV